MGEADATQKYDKKVKGFVLHDVPFFSSFVFIKLS
jgi:hypothetical protein